MNFTMKGNVEDKERFLSALGGGAMLLYALRVKGPLGDALSALGKKLVRRGATSYAGPPATQIEASVTIGRSREEVYQFCCDLTNLPWFVRGIEEVKRLNGGRSRWVAGRKGGAPDACDIEILEDVENERISWRSVDGQGVTRSGVLYLTPAPGGRGVEVCVILDITLRGGQLFGRRAALRRGEQAELVLRGDLRRLKQLLEVGHVTTTRGQPSGR